MLLLAFSVTRVAILTSNKSLCQNRIRRIHLSKICLLLVDAPHLPPPQQEQHMDDVFSATCVGELWRGVHKCARVSVSVVHGVHSVQNVVGPDGGFQRVFCEVWRTFAECVGLCRRTRRASESV